MRAFLKIDLILFCVWAFCDSETESKSLVKYESFKKHDQVDCKSKSISLADLKAAASLKVSCKGNDDQKFWRLACECASNNKPCPKCRISRDLNRNEVQERHLRPTESPSMRSHHSSPSTISRGTGSQQGIRDLLEWNKDGVNRDGIFQRNSIDESAPDADYFSSKLKTAQNVTTLSTSQNFIRFGK